MLSSNPSGKRVKTGGRVKGVPNNATIARQNEIAASGLTPLEYMISVMRDENNAQDVRVDAARSAAPYIHPKLAQTTLTADVTVKHEAKKELLDALVGLIAKAKG